MRRLADVLVDARGSRVAVGRGIGALRIVERRKGADDLLPQGVGCREQDVPVIAVMADTPKPAVGEGAGEVARAAFAGLKLRRAVVSELRVDVARVVVVGAQFRERAVGDGDARAGEAEDARARPAGVEGVARLVDRADVAGEDDPVDAEARAGVGIGRAERKAWGLAVGKGAIAPQRPVGEPRKLPAVLSAGEVVRFLEAVSSLKARVALTTAYTAGLRVSEVVGLKAPDIDSDRMVIRVECGKGGKERYVMLSEQLLGILRSYWRLAHPERFLFPGRDKHRPIEPTVLHAACRSARVAAGIDKRVSVHVLRHNSECRIIPRSLGG